MNNSKWKKPESKCHILYDFIYMTFWNRQDYRDRLDRGFQKLEVGVWGEAEYKKHEGIWGDRTALCCNCSDDA